MDSPVFKLDTDTDRLIRIEEKLDSLLCVAGKHNWQPYGEIRDSDDGVGKCSICGRLERFIEY